MLQQGPLSHSRSSFNAFTNYTTIFSRRQLLAGQLSSPLHSQGLGDPRARATRWAYDLPPITRNNIKHTSKKNYRSNQYQKKQHKTDASLVALLPHHALPRYIFIYFFNYFIFFFNLEPPRRNSYIKKTKTDDVRQFFPTRW